MHLLGKAKEREWLRVSDARNDLFSSAHTRVALQTRVALHEGTHNLEKRRGENG